MTILDLLTNRSDGATLTEIAHDVGETPSNLVHVMAALTSAGYLVREPSDRRYHLGPALVEPGRAAAERYPALAAARSQMEELSRTFGWACYAFVRDGRRARLVHYTWDAHHPVPAMRIGELVPVVAPLGAVFVAWGDESEIDRWLAAAPDLDDAAAGRLRSALRRARRGGYVVESQPPTGVDEALLRMLQDRPSPRRDRELRRRLVDVEEHVLGAIEAKASYRITAIGAPVFDPAGHVSMSLTMGGFDDVLAGSEVRRLGRAVRAAAEATTEALGVSSPATAKQH